MNQNCWYHPNTGFKCDLSAGEMAEAAKDERSVLWLDVCDIDDKDIDILTQVFGLHPLTIEDFIMPNARPKIEEFPEYFFLVIFSIQAIKNLQRHKIQMTEVNCCLGKNFLITYHADQVDFVSTCRERIAKQPPLTMQSADMLLHSILDSCVDRYFPIFNEFDRVADEMSDELFKSPDQETLKKIYYIKNDIMDLRRTVGPQADVINMLARGTIKFIAPANIIYFRNIYDNMVRFNDMVGALRDIITGAMEAYVSIVSNRLNEIMKTLTVIATIMMPLTLIASIYGMNFKFMPELESPFGYPAIMLVMFIITILMLLFFKRKKWL